MLNQKSIEAVNAASLPGDTTWAKPLYDSYCFSRIQATILRLLSSTGNGGLPSDCVAGVSTADKVIALWIDAFGWAFFERYADKYPFLKRFIDHGIVNKATSAWPSTTSVHTSTLHTGMLPPRTGVVEWFYYEPLIDAMITPLLYNYAGETVRETLDGVLDAKAAFPIRSIYATAYREQNIHAYVYQNAAYAHSSYGSVIMHGAHIRPYATLADGLTELGDQLAREKAKKAYYFFYIDSIDTVGHRRGPNSRHFANEIDAVFTQLERILQPALNQPNTVLMLFADHGQIAVDPKRTVYLDDHREMIEPWLRRSEARNLPLIPGGSNRDMIVYVKPEYLDEAEGWLTQHLSGVAHVRRTADLLADGMFGPDAPSPAFLAHAGDLWILPTADHTVWWRMGGKPKDVYGMHGGLSRAEMEIPILVLPL